MRPWGHRVAATSIGALALVGCTTTEQAWSDLFGQAREIPVERITGTLTLTGVGATGSLPRRHATEVDRLIAGLGDPYGVRVELATAIPGDVVPAGGALAQLSRRFTSAGVAAEHVTFIHEPTLRSRIEVTAYRYVAAGPACAFGQRDPLGGDFLTGQPTGCANAVALAQMIADPADLIRGRAFAGPEADRESRIVRRYRTGSGEEGPGGSGATGGATGSEDALAGLLGALGAAMGSEGK